MGLLLILIGLVVAIGVDARPESVTHSENPPLRFESEAVSSAQLNVKLSYEPYEETWANFKLTFGELKSNNNNVKRIEEHNHMFFNSKTTYWMGINQFTDMTIDEYRMYNKLKTHNNSSRVERSPGCPAQRGLEEQRLRDTGQEPGDSSGSCWAFSTTGSLEAAVQGHETSCSLSEQQLVDCSSVNDGCNGGEVDDAFAYIEECGGLAGESDYPYEAQDDQCRFNHKQVKATMRGCRDVTKRSETDLLRAVASQGPVSVAIDASHESFMSYAGGVYYEPYCSQDQLDHAVLVVGYGTRGGKRYWLVKNSWDTTWGEEGYILMAKDQENMCGIASDASFPIV
ncbi:hypothetical protein BaRGS_00017225 [Batillaria attramentaria]|uniref:Uncharacterized protein n=1 Tax=Batillaria attramentaria TaxID=370345 RepID=A0ABD0KX27_9CAEN